jgi:hypothetical protein
MDKNQLSLIVNQLSEKNSLLKKQLDEQDKKLRLIEKSRVQNAIYAKQVDQLQEEYFILLKNYRPILNSAQDRKLHNNLKYEIELLTKSNTDDPLPSEAPSSKSS